MPITKIGLNMNLTNMTQINTSSIPQTATEILTALPTQANVNTNYWFGFIALVVVWIVSYIAFGDKTPFSEFKYSEIRSINLALGVSAVFGIVGVETGIFLDLVKVMFFVTLFFVSYIFVLALDNKET